MSRRAERADLLTTAQAARRAGVPPHIVKTWARLGLITNRGAGGKGSVAMWDPDEVRTAPDRRVNLRVGWRGRAMTEAERQANDNLARGIVPTVPHSLPYRALAWTCGKCGDLVSPTSIRRSEPRTMRGHRCDREYVRERRARDDLYRDALRARANAAYHARQQRTVDGAGNHGKEWTGPELEIAARLDLSTEQVAAILGRTAAGVMWARKQIQRDPRKARLAGIRSAVADKARP